MSTPSSRIRRKIARTYESGGIRGVLHLCRAQLLRLSRHRVFLRDLSANHSNTDQPDMLRQVEVVYLHTAADLDIHRAHLAALPQDLEEYWNGIRDHNTHGLLLLVDGKPAHWAFVMSGSRTSRLLGFSRDVALLGSSFTVADHRRQGLQTLSTHLRLQMASDFGATLAVAETAMDNHFSARALKTAGMREVGSVTLWTIFGHLVVRIGHGEYHPRWFGYAR